MEFKENNSCSVDWDDHFTEDVIRLMDAIEATPPPPLPPSSSLKKRKSAGHHQDKLKTGRQLPHSILSPPPSFPSSFAHCQCICYPLLYPFSRLHFLIEINELINPLIFLIGS